MRLLFGRKSHKTSSGQAAERLSVYLDGEAPTGEAQAIEQRLAEDPALRSDRAAFTALDCLLGDWPAPDRMPDLRPAVLARVERDLAPLAHGWWLGQWGRPSWAAAFMFGGVLAGLALWMGASGHLSTRANADRTDHELVLSLMLTGDVVAIPGDAEADANPEESLP